MTESKEFAENRPLALSNEERATLNLSPKILARMRRISEFYDETLSREYREAEMRAERAVFDKITSESDHYIESNPEPVTVTSTYLPLEQQDKMEALEQKIYHFGRQISALQQVHDQKESSAQKFADRLGRNDDALAGHEQEIAILKLELEQIKKENDHFKLEIEEIREIVRSLAPAPPDPGITRISPTVSHATEPREQSIETMEAEPAGYEAPSQEDTAEDEALAPEEHSFTPESYFPEPEEQSPHSGAILLKLEDEPLESDLQEQPTSEITFDTLLHHYNITRPELVSTLQNRFESWDEKTLKELAMHMYLAYKAGNIPATLDELINTAYVKLRFSERNGSE
ncbi:hypothetical protein F6R98_02505 [Candidatus Methylospira mobilis]|uniref:Uncharacterized protein n=1 Tax=Candidatus Methylospira mobilis TaxID=1808979 RepID=A0A5Q0BES3_9GAMM|nr:hypothetical protein [Candidatus Methylospira mobilis]QFY41632.1 hypothetical protein F6R98_02505 [Candidatus Methylospira mobilis]